MDNKRIKDGKPLDCRGVYCGSKANNNIEGSDKSMNMYVKIDFWLFSNTF